MISRAERTVVGEWWWTVDRLLLGALAALMIIGIVLALAASPPVASRLGIADPFHFVNRQVMFLLPALIVLIGTSFLSPKQIRRVALVLFLLFLGLVCATLVFGPEVKGARRWLNIGPIALQPSEFLKPSFVIIAAWLFSESVRRPEMPGQMMAVALLGSVVTPLVLQPDFGQTMLVSLVWGGLFFLAGLRMIWVVGLGGVGAAGLFLAYQLVPHVTKRIDRFLDPESGDTYQIDLAIDSFLNGGWLGQGPGEGTFKKMLPDGHTDFIFAVAAEEFGAVLCIMIACLFAFIVLRALSRAMHDEDPFVRFAVAGLAMLFGLQSCINMMVNLHMMPAKGMTLPFVSYGGSSLLSLAFGMGMLLALTRRRPRSATLAELERLGTRLGSPASTPAAATA
ncbi:putative lipid II flippase FtsW [Ancylobacter defluvii]|uniref:Probable peptidoglycan glycosyltransferase FtsW n=1 Tax=Ancylobacter defluvii TaxID=1282440 RepID=A0A9W6N972_9HYPH|nr:putative lipid II flippase FtsW [Ancylobacter defluvii]MBS7587579.1 putative lipid II flippase FtsW [Ancylobacter defluvii]GLK82270.1 cell division protein FtsW [Ancylobacter defluvii]